MPYRRFLLWNVIGGIAWAVIFAIAGFYLGKIPVIANNVDVIAVGIVILSLIPIGITVVRESRSREHDRQL
jgi:membrane-associated protein